MKYIFPLLQVLRLSRRLFVKELPSFRFLHRRVINCSYVSQEYIAYSFRVTALDQVETEILIQSKLLFF